MNRGMGGGSCASVLCDFQKPRRDWAPHDPAGRHPMAPLDRALVPRAPNPNAQIRLPEVPVQRSTAAETAGMGQATILICFALHILHSTQTQFTAPSHNSPSLVQLLLSYLLTSSHHHPCPLLPIPYIISLPPPCS